MEALNESPQRSLDAALGAYNLGASHAAAGRHGEAVLALEQAVALEPRLAPAWYNLGNSLCHQGELARAAAAYGRALRDAPRLVEAWINLGNCQASLGRHDEARAAYESALALAPERLAPLCGLGWSLLALEEPARAARTFERALELDAGCARAYAGLGAVLRKAGRFHDAVLSCERAIAFDAALPKAHETRAVALLDHGRAAEALDAFRRAAAIGASRGALSNIAFAANYVDGLAPAELLAAAQAAGAAFAAPGAGPARPGARRGRARLRVGFLSRDLRRHSVGYFMAPVFEHLDRARFEVFCYYTWHRSDDLNARFRARADAWLDCRDLADSELAARIEADGLDLLVELSGHTDGNRLGVLARRPAPVQATYLGYPTSTGLDAIRYRLTDGVVDPEGEAGRNVETPLRLPGSYFCYGGPLGAEVPVAAPPALASGFVTFGSFNNLAKLSPATMRLWARVLAAVPGARMKLKSKALVDERSRADVVRRLEAAGIDPARLALAGWKERTDEHLAAYGEIDIALDSSPYNGATTTCEALWMGVPVVSLAGATHAGRMGLSILAAAGLGGWACASPEEYVARAVELAADPSRLAATRAGLRARLQASRLMDARGFVRDLEQAFERMAAG